jgi:hypothetical protein
VRLYPPAWQRRYGQELRELISTQPFSFGTALDLVAGAIDAWLNPQASTAVPAAEAKGAGAMVSEILKLRCAGHGSAVTAADHRKAAAITIVGTLVVTTAYVWMSMRYGNGPYLTSLISVSWLVPYVYSQRYTTLKGRSARVQTVLIGGQAAFVIAIALGAAWFSIWIRD